MGQVTQYKIKCCTHKSSTMNRKIQVLPSRYNENSHKKFTLLNFFFKTRMYDMYFVKPTCFAASLTRIHMMSYCKQKSEPNF